MNRRATRWAWVFTTGLLAACHPRSATRPTSAPSAFEDLPYASAPQDPPPRIFLVAGGDDIANFAAEVLEQRTLWRRAGVPERDIACYYTKPSAQAWREDRAQYERLAPALASCRRASPSQLFADLAAAAAVPGDYLYLFVTAHGLQTQLPRGAELSTSEREVMGPAAIGLDAGPHPQLGRSRALVAKLREGTPAQALVFTPRTLAAALAAFDPGTEKIVVLQACFAGGFIDHHATASAPASTGADALRAVANLTVLTATAAERPSFGCDAGLQRTYFGGAVNTALKRTLHTGMHPADVDWVSVFDRVSFAIEAMEHVDGQRASNPGFFSNTAAQPESDQARLR